MTQRLKIELFELLDQGAIDEVFVQMNIYFEENKEAQNTFEKNYNHLKERFKELSDKQSEGAITPVSFEKKWESSKHQLRELISSLTQFSPPKERQSQPRVKVEKPPRVPKPQNRKPPRSKPSSSIFGGIIDQIKKIPGSLFPTKSSSKPDFNVEGERPRKKSKPPVLDRMEDDDVAHEVSGGLPSTEIPVRTPPKPSPVMRPSPPPPPPVPTSPSPTQAGGMQSPFQKGKILYAIPSQMCIGKESRCKVRIAPDQFSIKEMEEGLSDKDKTTAKNEGIRITSVMKVELVENGDVDNFDISNRSSTEQPILPFGFTEWTFDVTAKRPGHHALLLRVIAKINIAGFGERSFDVAVLDRAILVGTSDENMAEMEFAEQAVPDPEWNEEDENVVLSALEKGRIDQVIERIANFVQDKDPDFHTDLILLHARWNDNTNQLQEKRITAADWDIVNNKVRFAITQLLDQLKVSFPPGTSGEVMDWGAEREKLKM